MEDLQVVLIYGHTKKEIQTGHPAHLLGKKHRACEISFPVKWAPSERKPEHLCRELPTLPRKLKMAARRQGGC